MEKTTLMQIPAVALRGLVIMPGMIIHFDLSREKSIRAVEQAMIDKQMLFVVTQKDENVEEPCREDLYDIGTIAKLKQMSKLPNGIVRVLVEGVEKGRLLEIDALTDDYLLADVESVQTATALEVNEHEAMLRQLRDLFHGYAALYPKNGKLLDKKLESLKNLDLMVDVIASSLPLPTESKQQVLSAIELQERYDTLSSILYNEIQVGTIRKELSDKIQKKVNKHQKDYLLREQLHAIRDELGENDAFSDADQFLEKVQQLNADNEVKEKITKEISRFKSLSSSSSESAVERAYIETLLELPWNKMSKDNTDLNHAEKILEADHYGMEKVKERVLEFLAVRSLLGEKNVDKQPDSPIICLVGPPGTGKTSIAKSMARALCKEYVRISLGGVRDEAEIRGHRKTYVGAMPGRIAGALKQAGVGNPLILLDEIDKAGKDHKGDTAAALLEVLDGEQNCHFRDHYVEIPLDLSKVLFVATANSAADIPKPLLDRMEIIEVSSYTSNEKFHIAKKYLLKKAYEKNGLSKKLITISDGAVKAVIEGYTREAGVRGLERKINEICRKAAKQLLEAKPEEREGMLIKVTAQNIDKYLGREKYIRDKIDNADEVGIVRGLAWTSVGGDTLQIEVNRMPGKGALELTGKMGDVMKESAMTALSYVRSISREYLIPADLFQKQDFHIHIPEGAVPKDGPSAGITMATALLSAITEIKVRADVAMTGEITLRGRVLAIGGLKEKLLAAKNAGIKKVLVPFDNKEDVEEISQEIKSGLEICFVKRMDEVLKEALVKEDGRDKV